MSKARSPDAPTMCGHPSYLGFCDYCRWRAGEASIGEKCRPTPKDDRVVRNRARFLYVVTWRSKFDGKHRVDSTWTNSRSAKRAFTICEDRDAADQINLLTYKRCGK